jgi:ArsR family transcriptional regulator
MVCWHNYQQGMDMKKITFQEAEIRAKVIKAMAHPVRLMVIEFLKEGERSFSKIFDLFQLDKSTVSKHLRVLKEAGIVSSRKDGADMIYRLEVPCVTDFFQCVTAVIKSNVKKGQACLCR